jgi:hypothetical protein
VFTNVAARILFGVLTRGAKRRSEAWTAR